MVVTFCGHSSLATGAYCDIKKRVISELEALISEGADTFLLGGYGDFDTLCAVAVRELKEKYPHIRSVLVIPYIDRTFDKALYDESMYPDIENVPKRFAISYRNKEMVKRADALVAYITHEFGGAYTTYKFAKSKKKRIIEI